MTTLPDNFLAALKKCAIIPVITIDDIGKAAPLAKRLAKQGYTLAEVTLRTDAATAAITEMKKAVPELIIGAGTVLDQDDIDRALEAGSDFLVSPATSARLASRLKDVSVPVFPGVATATEAQTLYEQGFKTLKFFPAESNGGILALKSMAAPMPHLKFMPTGGITEQTAKQYLKLPNVIAVGGSWML